MPLSMPNYNPPKLKYFIALFVFVFGTTNSFSQKVDSVKIGSGGGFTGAATVYTLSKGVIKREKGTVAAKQSYTTKFKAGNFKKDRVKSKEIYKSIPEFSHPYNTYQLLE